MASPLETMDFPVKSGAKGEKTSENQSIEWLPKLLKPLVEFGDDTMTIHGQSRSQVVGYPQVRPAMACWSLRTAGGILNWQERE